MDFETLLRALRTLPKEDLAEVLESARKIVEESKGQTVKAPASP